MSQRHEGANDVLARLRGLIERVTASGSDDPDQELHAEYERWKLRFELLASSGHN